METHPKEKKKMTPEKRKEVIKEVITIGIIIAATFSFMPLMKVALKTEYPMVVVISESMEPNIMVGDLLIIGYKDPADIVNGTVEDQTGDVILYDCHGLGWEQYMSAQYIPDEPIVHRVVGKYFNETDQQYYFYTCGDNNHGDIDPPELNRGEIPIPEDHLLGVVKARIPKIGWIKIWLSTNNALSTILIAGLAVLLLISIIQDIMHPEEEKKKEKKEKDKKEFVMKVREEKVEQTNTETETESETETEEKKFDLGV